MKRGLEDGNTVILRWQVSYFVLNIKCKDGHLKVKKWEKGKGKRERKKEKGRKTVQHGGTDLQHVEQRRLSGIIETQEEQLRMLIQKPER